LTDDRLGALGIFLVRGLLTALAACLASPACTGRAHSVGAVNLIALALLSSWHAAKAEDMSFELQQRDLRPNFDLDQWIFADGEIVQGTTGRFLAFVKAHPQLRDGATVILNSPGGSPLEGIRLRLYDSKPSSAEVRVHRAQPDQFRYLNELLFRLGPPAAQFPKFFRSFDEVALALMVFFSTNVMRFQLVDFLRGKVGRFLPCLSTHRPNIRWAECFFDQLMDRLRPRRFVRTLLSPRVDRAQKLFGHPHLENLVSKKSSFERRTAHRGC
jgi:hypothetical protein